MLAVCPVIRLSTVDFSRVPSSAKEKLKNMRTLGELDQNKEDTVTVCLADYMSVDADYANIAERQMAYQQLYWCKLSINASILPLWST